jgi:carboxypeptidase PM20D1
MDTAVAIENFRQLLQIRTVSRFDESLTDWSEFDRFIETLERLYPLVHSSLEREVIARHSVLFRWRGMSPGDPAVLMAHYDVVPATPEGWMHPPFAAEISGEGDDRVLWARGTLDDKGALVCIFEAFESSLAQGLVPEHDVYVSLGHNEETTGSGASAIVDELDRRGIRPAVVLDEGGAVIENVFPGVSDPVAAVGVSEKGIVNLTLTVEQDGGHASTPPRMTATVRLARAITRLNSRPFPARFSAANIAMFEALGKHARGIFGWLLRHHRFSSPALLFAFTRLSDETNAVTRTTSAVTMLSASESANALAERAVATVNIRIAIGSSVAQTIEHVRKAVRDPKVQLDALHPNEPSLVSPATGEAWQLISSAITATFPTAIIAPYVMLGATDSRHFARISQYIYRFSPFEMSTSERASLHAINERIPVATFLRGIEFYRALVARL